MNTEQSRLHDTHVQTATRTPGRSRIKGILPHSHTASELVHMDLPIAEQLVPSILPGIGFCLLASKPKAGKTLWSMNAALAVATGGMFLGQRVQQRRVLYFDLEGNLSLFKNRMSKMREWIPNNKMFVEEHFEKRFSRDGRDWLRTVIQQGGFGLVVIDTLGLVLPSRTDVADYGNMLPIADDLNQLAYDTSSVILGLWHTTKRSRQRNGPQGLDALLGSTGLSAGIDTGLILERESSRSNRATLEITARGFETDDLNLELNTENLTWCISGNADDGLTPVQAKVYEELKSMGIATEKTLAKRLKKSPQAVSNHLKKLEKMGKVRRDSEGIGGKSWQYKWSAVGSRTMNSI
jgi:hypothetical protein